MGIDRSCARCEVVGSLIVIPFRTGVPFLGQCTQIPCSLSPRLDCGPKRIKEAPPKGGFGLQKSYVAWLLYRLCISYQVYPASQVTLWPETQVQAVLFDFLCMYTVLLFRDSGFIFLMRFANLNNQLPKGGQRSVCSAPARHVEFQYQPSSAVNVTVVADLCMGSCCHAPCRSRKQTIQRGPRGCPGSFCPTGLPASVRVHSSRD